MIAPALVAERGSTMGYDIVGCAGELDSLAGTIDQTFTRAGVRSRTRQVDGHMVHEIYVPSPQRPLLITARVALPGDEIGAFGKRIKKVTKKVAKVAKKVAKSKAFGALAKVIGPVSVAFPALAPLAAGVTAARLATKVVKAAKKGNPKAKKLMGKAVKGIHLNLKAATNPRAAARIAQRGVKLPGFGPASFRVLAPTGGEESVTL